MWKLDIVQVGPPDKAITVYATSGCADCMLAKFVLESQHAKYEWVDIDKEPLAAETVLELNGGYRIVPTIVFPDGRVLVEPSRRQLEAALEV
jgi:mycoredoxin